MATPAEVVRAQLVRAKLCVYPGIEQQPDYGPFQCFTGELDDKIDNALALIDVSGSLQGREMKSGETLEHFGFKVHLRSLKYEDADLIFSVRDYFNRTLLSPFDVYVRDRYAYHVHSVYCTSGVISLGEEKGTRRYNWILNARVVFRDPMRTKLED